MCDTMRKIIAKNKLKSPNSHRYVQSIGVFKTPNKFHQPRIKECELGKIGKPHQVVNSYQRTVRKRSPAEDRQWTTKGMYGVWKTSFTEKMQSFWKICRKCKNQNHFASQCLSKSVLWICPDSKHLNWAVKRERFQLPTSNFQQLLR